MYSSLQAALALLATIILPAVTGRATSHLLARRWGEHEIHEKRNGDPIAWTKLSRAAEHENLPLRIGLKQRNLEHADRFLHEVSDPDSPKYAGHWTAEEVANTFAPAKETTDQTLEWLSSHGVGTNRIQYSKGRNWIEINSTVAEAERLFRTEYFAFQHKLNGGHRVACDSYGLPKSMKQHIDFVMPTIHLDGLQPVAQTKRTYSLTPRTGLTGTANCDEMITIDCLRAIYNFGKGNYSAASNKMGIGEWSNYLQPDDLKIYFENYTSPKIPSNTFPDFISIDGGEGFGPKTNMKIAESALDIQTAYSMIWPQQIRLYQVGDGVNVDGVGTFNIFLDALDASYCTYMGGDQPYLDPQYPDPNQGGYTRPIQCGGAPKSNVISISYSQIEAALPRFYQKRQCYEWMKLALQGVSVFFSSGDAGVANNYNFGTGLVCVNVQHGYVDANGTQFAPSFPVNCPYVTSVGGTNLKTGSVHGGEVAGSRDEFSSGGGFSNIFERPSYQNGPVNHYLKTYAPKYAPNVYNRTGRGFPDVSALSLGIAVVINGTTALEGGTSASAPIFASVISLINEERIHAGKKSVGFINPTIYKHPEMFNDVVGGSNPGCGTNGFTAVEGWDPVTGMGSPDYEKMQKVFIALP